MRILVVMSQFGCGGSETVVYRLLNNAKYFGINMHLAVLGEIDTEHFIDLIPDKLSQKIFDKKSGKLKSNFAKIKFIRKLVKSLDIQLILSFIDVTNILTILAATGLKMPVIISERNNPTRSNMSRIWYLLRRITYSFADSLVVSNKGLSSAVRRYHNNVCIIPNLMGLSGLKVQDGSQNRIIAVGSLTQQKRFDVLIKAIKILSDKNKLDGFYLDIYGEGLLFPILQNLIDDCRLHGTVHLKGKSDNIFDIYTGSKIFVLCSDYEGQPNVLLEAMSVGLPCIATDCEFGPSELIIDGQNGLLVPTNNPDILARSILSLIESKKQRERLGHNAREYIYGNFTDNRIMSKWLDLFKSMIGKYESRHSAFQ